MIPTTPEEALSVIRKWKDDKARIRFSVASELLAAAFDCSAISVSAEEIGLQVSGQPKGACAIRISDCEFSFGADDVPEPETEIGLRFDTGLTILSPRGEAVWLLEKVS